MYKTLTSLALVGLLFSGCGSSSSDESVSIDLPDGKTFIFFDNESSMQYQYNSDSETALDMNIDATQNYAMNNKHGRLIFWEHQTDTGIDEKIVMLKEHFSILDGNLSAEDFHYLGHFHAEDNEPVFAAHAASEFDGSSEQKMNALTALNQHLHNQELQKEELSALLPVDETLCNFYENHESGVHFLLSNMGKLYFFKEDNATLSTLQNPIGLEGVASCSQERSSIIPYGESGVLIFSAESQKLYLVDEHGMDFHQHSSWNIHKFLPFAPTQCVAIGEAEHDEH